jgi:NAD dependent epimerase/dehydratase family enzyme
VPWIGVDDVLGGLYHTLWTDALEGPVNLTAPQPAPMEDYAGTLAEVLERAARLHLPPSLLRAVGGEMADEMALKSARVVPERLVDSGYRFGHEELDGAFRHLLGRTRTTGVRSP